MHTRTLLVSLALCLLVPGAASASLADEQRQGRDLAAQVRSGAKGCEDLSTEDFDHLGEYVMGRFLGSTNAHQAMNDRMRLMMGDQAEQRMHQLMGRRYAGCYDTSTGAGNGSMGPGMMGGAGLGPGMIGGYYGRGGWGAMMRSGDWDWMMGGGWRNMSRQDWQRLQQQWLGTSASSDGGWSPWAIIAVTLGSVLLVALAILALVRGRPPRRPPAQASPS